MFEGSVPGFFGIVWKAAAGQMPAFKMIPDTLAAKTLSSTWVIAAVAGRKIFFFIALHRQFLSWFPFDI